MFEFNVIVFLTDQVNLVVCKYAAAGPRYAVCRCVKWVDGMDLELEL